MKFLETINRSRILLVNEDRLTQKSLYELLCRHGHKVDIANSTEEAVALLNEKSFHIVLVDLNGSEGFGTLKTIRERGNSSEIIILASYGNLEAAVQSIKMGAFDYLVRPVEDRKIISAIERALANKPFEKEKKILIKKPLKKEQPFFDMVGKSPKVAEIYSLVERISCTKTTVLIRGESGTGKRLIAYSIHKADKKRKNKPFIEISCGALPREIIESELFGHTKGSFTGAICDRKGRFELADGGTMLLDDIDSLPPDLQVKLLRVLQQKEFERIGDHKTIRVDVRVIATTNQDIDKLVVERKFREDLFYRLNVISIDVPPLRERKEDLPPLAEHFMHLYAKENHKKIKGISKETLDVLMGYDWPGNIRQLENIIERAVILDTNDVIDKDDLPAILINRPTLVTSALSAIEALKSISLKDALREPEKVHILRVLKEVNWNKKKAAIKLGINRTTLYNKMRKYNLVLQLDEKFDEK